MCATNFYDFQSPDAVARRAGGRRRYNAERQAEAIARRLKILELVGASWILSPRGLQAQLARYFGVNRSTICRDMEALREEWRHTRVCRVCGSLWGCTLRAHAYLYKLQKRSEPGLEPSCCVRGYLAREAVRKKKRATDLERRFRRAAER